MTDFPSFYSLTLLAILLIASAVPTVIGRKAGLPKGLTETAVSGLTSSILTVSFSIHAVKAVVTGEFEPTPVRVLFAVLVLVVPAAFAAWKFRTLTGQLHALVGRANTPAVTAAVHDQSSEPIR